MPTHISFFWYKIKDRYRFSFRDKNNRAKRAKLRNATNIHANRGRGWRNAVDEPKIQHVCPY